jgi:hypothetical protein
VLFTSFLQIGQRSLRGLVPDIPVTL